MRNELNILEDLACDVSIYPSSNPLHLLALTLNDDIPGLNRDLDPLGDLEQFLGVAVAQLLAHAPTIGQFPHGLIVCVSSRFRERIAR